MAAELPLVVIVGPTASGKTSLAIELAEKYNGEIICADSRTVYSGMDIGTAKPNHTDQARVIHWGLDLVEPGQHFSAAAFQSYALQKIEEIRARGHVPFLVGGTGLYIDGVLYNYQFGQKADTKQRQMLESMTVEELQKYCIYNNIILPNNGQNKRHLVRAIEQNGINQKRSNEPISTSIIVGITTERDVLRERIKARAEQLFDYGVVDEAITLGKKYGWGSEAMTGNIYPLIHDYTQGLLTLEQVKARFVVSDWRLAKRQLTWLRRNKDIKWLELDDARAYLSAALA